MFETGFLGTRAPFFMDVVTIFFALVPFLVAISIYFAVRGKYLLHFRSQMATFVLSMLMVVVFEIGVRIDGGFNAYMQESTLSYNGVLIYLVIHILFALATVVAWGITIYSSYKVFRQEGAGASYFREHKKRARWLFLAIIINSIMGVSMYPILFIS